ncbi:hypothetical protein TNCV_1134911 [Trichonephila clavipes]|nr:hypothetical protein TNCV_1134911 [Trichonephila clavipes]
MLKVGMPGEGEGPRRAVEPLKKKKCLLTSDNKATKAIGSNSRHAGNELVTITIVGVTSFWALSTDQRVPLALEDRNLKPENLVKSSLSRPFWVTPGPWARSPSAQWINRDCHNH